MVDGEIVERRKPRVVIVDDSRTIQALLSERFSNHLGWDVVGIAGSSGEAVKLIHHVHPDIVTVDLVLPDGDGFSLLESLLDQAGICKIIIASNFDADVSLSRRAKSLGVAMHVDKKWIMQKPGELCAKLRAAAIAHHQRTSKVGISRAVKRATADAPLIGQSNPSYPVPVDEQERLRLVASLDLESLSPDPQFDLITEHLSKVIDFPAIVMTILGREFQWIKSAVGMPLSKIDRREAFCNYAICCDGMLAIPNTTLDDRFKANPLVTGGPGIRAYFAYPIEGYGGVKVGALCAIDIKPRHESGKLLTNLEGLARIASSIIRSRSLGLAAH